VRNDGKPREEWAPGVDLKEAVLIGLLVVVVMALVGLMAYALLRPF
jgi:flagellar basal body-associated protein FliL